MKVLALRERFPHMGNRSGYDLLFHELEKNSTVTLDSVHFHPAEKLRFPLRGICRHLKKKYVSATPYYASVQNVAAELRTIRKAPAFDLLHIAYLENSYGLLKNDVVRNYLRNTKIVATAHQPASWWRLNARPRLVDKLDALIVLSPVEQEYFEPFLPGRVFCVRHGVDTNFFQPLSGSKTEFRCVFAGQWLRDVSTLIEVIEKIIHIKPSIQFDIIYPGTNRLQNFELYRLAKYKQVVWHQDLSNEELCRVYQHASVLLLPLLDCTANNALLEGMSCGLPVVSSDIPAVHHYTHPTYTFLYKRGEEDKMAARVISLSDSDNDQYGSKARQFVLENFRWVDIAEQTLDIYRKVCPTN